MLCSEDAGHSFRECGAGLPAGDTNVYRDAFVAAGNPTTVFVGTSAGDVFALRDGDDTWRELVLGLPAVRAILPL